MSILRRSGPTVVPLSTTNLSITFNLHKDPFMDPDNNILSSHGVKGVKAALRLIYRTADKADPTTILEPWNEELYYLAGGKFFTLLCGHV